MCTFLLVALREMESLRGVGQVMSSKFCPNIYGDNPSSNRLFDAIVSHSISVIISDNRTSFRGHCWLFQILYLYTCIRCCQEGLLTESTWGNQTWRLKQGAERIKGTHHFECQYQSQEGDAVHMIWEAASCKISSVWITLHRENIFHQFQFTQNCDYMEKLWNKSDMVLTSNAYASEHFSLRSWKKNYRRKFDLERTYA